jgi:polysaccharide pyruvyl transferase WcaK-like protein
MNIIVLGYYSHGNYGDDLFEVIFKKLYVNYNLTFYDPNKLNLIPENVDIIVCGGGDIINDFFMKQIVKLKLSAEAKHKKKIPTYAISVGITYKKSVILGKSHYLDIFDYFIVRNKIDVDLLKQRYSEDHIIYMPDVVHLLEQYKPKRMLSYLTNLISKARPVLGIFLTNTIANEGKNTKYEEEVKNLVKLIEALPDKFDIHLVPFNTGANKHEMMIF